MAPLARPALLAVLLLTPAVLRAQSDPEGEASALAGMKALKAQYGAGAQRPADAAAAPGKLRASQDAIQSAGLKISDLIDASDDGMNWSVDNVRDFGPAIGAASKAVSDLHVHYPSAVADAYGDMWLIKSQTGKLTNMEDTFKALAGGRLERGCISHQGVTFDAVSPVLRNSSLVVRKIRIGTLLQHNAVIVFPKPDAAVAADADKLEAHWKRTGVIFDGWIRQRSEPANMTFRFKKWISIGDRPRLLRDDE